MTRHLFRLSAVAVVLLILFLLIQDFYLLDAEPIGGDAVQNVRSGLNLAKYGVYSESRISELVVPGYRREPFPNVVLAVYLRVAEAVQPGFLDQVGEPFSQSFLLFLKTINLFWAGSLFLALWLSSRLVFTPMYAANFLAAAQIALVNHFFVIGQIRRMNTELIAAAILVWLGVVLLVASRQKSRRWLLAAGLVLGSMALTKSSVAYVAILVLPLIAFLISGLSQRFWSLLITFSLGFLLIVGPWAVRNQIYFSKFAIAKGGGDVLLIRSVFNQMNLQEFRDSFYAFSPNVVRRDLLGPLMGLSDEELSCDGRLAVFERYLECDRVALKQERYGDVRSLYQRGKRALPYELSLNDSERKAYALREFSRNPLNVLTTSIPLSWRGFWGFRSRYWNGVLLNAFAFPALFLSPILSIVQRRLSWLMVSVVPISLFGFYALVSHFLPRYSLPIAPISVLCLTMLMVSIFGCIFTRFRPGEAPPVRLI
ncbi:hypothetical protein [Synechococcus sp. UW179A]|uniref:hypothetical protein n=1 Tax=Synechococcus sp. UW179A TaxID=2575510 RepID=UPI001A7E0EFA|nr:hypothetical protein [Synechococcus sp. UW179A]